MLSVLIMSLLALVSGAALGAAAARLRPSGHDLADKIHDVLPHTQCAQCGFAGCRPFAEALASGKARIDQCPPGGAALAQRLSDMLGVTAAVTVHRIAAPAVASIAFIDEARCIGCALCLDACPVDAIVGAPRYMHTVLKDACTGCELCLAPCPVDCIALRAANDATPQWALSTTVASTAKAA